MFERLKKHWYKSRTILFNLAHAIPAVIFAIIQFAAENDLAPIFGSKTAAAITIYMAFANVLWRAVTTKSLDIK